MLSIWPSLKFVVWYEFTLFQGTINLRLYVVVADDKLNYGPNDRICCFQKIVNIVRKGENVSHQLFLLSPLCFKELMFEGS